MEDIHRSSGQHGEKVIALNGFAVEVHPRRYRERVVDFEHKKILDSVEESMKEVSEEVACCRMGIDSNAPDKKDLKRAAENAIDRAVETMGGLNKRLKSDPNKGEEDGTGMASRIVMRCENRVESQELGMNTQKRVESQELGSTIA